MSNNIFGQKGVSSDLQFGKRGGRLKYDSISEDFFFRSDTDNFYPQVHGGTPTEETHFTTKQYVDDKDLDFNENDFYVTKSSANRDVLNITNRLLKIGGDDMESPLVLTSSSIEDKSRTFEFSGFELPIDLLVRTSNLIGSVQESTSGLSSSVGIASSGANKTASSNGSTVGNIFFLGYTGSAYEIAATVRSTAIDNFSSSNYPGNLEFLVSQENAGGLTTVAELDSSSSTFHNTLIGSGPKVIADGGFYSLQFGEVSYQNPGYIDNAKVTRINNTRVEIGEDDVISTVRDAKNGFDIQWTGAIIAQITSSGAGGLDTGSEAADTWYAIHVIADTSGVNPVDGLLSTSATNPVLPSGYNTFRRVGWIRNNASSNFIVGIQVGNGKQKWWHYSGPRTNTNILSAGNATTDTVLSAAAYVPPTSQLCHLNVDLDATSAWRDAGLRINSGGSGARTTRHWQFQLGAAPSTTMRVGTDVFFLDENQELIYSMDNSDSSITVHVVAYLDSL